MNYQDLTFDFVDRRRPQPPQFWSLTTPPEQSEARAHLEYSNRPQSHELIDDSGRQPSLSPQPTVVPFAPSPPQWQSSSSPSILGQYGDTRLFGHPLIDNRPAPALPMSGFSPTRKLEESRMAMDEMTSRVIARGYRDELAIDATGSVTPGMDDGPFLNFALDALTAERWPGPSSSSDSIPPRSGLTANGVPYELPEDYYEFDDDDSDPFPRQHITAGHELLALQPVASIPPARTRDSVRRSAHRPSTEQQILKPTPWGNLAAFNTTPPLTPVDPNKRMQALGQPGDENKIYPVNDTVPYTKDGKTRLDNIDPTRLQYPRLNYLPRILRPLSMIIFKIICVLMSTLFMVAAIVSLARPGLASFEEEIPNAQYFAFRIVPQLLAAAISIYAHCITTTMTRVMPFISMASEDLEARKGALFRDLHPASFLIPHLEGSPAIKACQILFWLSAFTIPFASHTFSVVLLDTNLTWTSVQPTTWILVVYYLCLLGAAITLNKSWNTPQTGLLWDPRSLADIAAMLYKSNTLDDYKGTEMLDDEKQIQSKLYRRHIDRLGYWRTGAPDQEPWYGIGLAAEYLDQPPRDFEALPGEEMNTRESINSLKMSLFSSSESSQYLYLPWILRSMSVASYVVGAVALLGVLLGVSFMRGASWLGGFNLGHLAVYPGLGSFSPANFVYSYFPSLLGTMLYLSFQSVDMTLRITEPWAELNRREGSLPQRSILADYAACLPFQATWHALKNRHWRVAFVSLMAVLSILIPILAGGMFMAVDRPDATNSIMYPNDVLFYILLALVILYVVGLATVVLKRSRYRLPHAVTSISDIVSFLNTEDVRNERAFQFPRTKEQIIGHLDLSKRSNDLWYFGSAPGREERVGVRRVKRFTSRKA